MPVDFSNAQSIMYWGAVVDDSTAHTEQPVKTPEQIAEELHQNNVGVGLFCLLLVLVISMMILADRKN